MKTRSELIKAMRQGKKDQKDFSTEIGKGMLKKAVEHARRTGDAYVDMREMRRLAESELGL